MTEYAFYRVSDQELKNWGLDPPPMPVRKGMKQEIFGGNQVRLDLLTDELRRYLAEFPEKFPFYASSVEIMFLLAGMDLEKEGNAAAAALCLVSGLGIYPESLLLRYGYAVVLHQLGRLGEARIQFETILADPVGRESPLACLLAARLYVEQGDHLEACRLMDMLEDRRTAAAPERPAVIAQASPHRFCAACGVQARLGARFCRECGKPL